MVLGVSAGSEPLRDVKEMLQHPEEGANANEAGKLAPECCLNCNLLRQFWVIHKTSEKLQILV